MTSYFVDVNANEKGVRAKSLAPGAIDTVTFSAKVAFVEVMNMDGAAPIYVTTDGTLPSVAGTNTYVLPATINSVKLQVPTSGNTVLQLISPGAPSYAATWSPS